MSEPKLEIVTLQVCSLCLDGAGGICHVPGCALCRSIAPDIPIRDSILPNFLQHDNALLLAIRDAVAAHKASFGKCLADALEAERDIYRALDAYDNRESKP